MALQLDALLKDLEGKGEAVLRALYTDALQAESDARKELYVLRLRLANLSTDAANEEEKLIAEAKQRLSDALTYVKAVESKLGNRPQAPTPAPAKVEAPEPVTVQASQEPAPEQS